MNIAEKFRNVGWPVLVMLFVSMAFSACAPKKSTVWDYYDLRLLRRDNDADYVPPTASSFGACEIEDMPNYSCE